MDDLSREIHLLKTRNCYGGERASESKYQSNYNLRLKYLFRILHSAYTCSNLDSDSDSIAEPYLYEPVVEYSLHLQGSLTLMKDSTTQTGEAIPLFWLSQLYAVIQVGELWADTSGIWMHMQVRK